VARLRVPGTASPHAAGAHSRTRPPSRSCRRIRSHDPPVAGPGPTRPAGCGWARHRPGHLAEPVRGALAGKRQPPGGRVHAWQDGRILLTSGIRAAPSRGRSPSPGGLHEHSEHPAGTATRRRRSTRQACVQRADAPGADQATISRRTDDRGPENDGDGISSPRPLIMARQPAHRRQPPRRVTAARSASTRYPPISAACGSVGMIAGTAHTNQSAG
jgi:hypothetical protein